MVGLTLSHPLGFHWTSSENYLKFTSDYPNPCSISNITPRWPRHVPSLYSQIYINTYSDERKIILNEKFFCQFFSIQISRDLQFRQFWRRRTGKGRRISSKLCLLLWPNRTVSNYEGISGEFAQSNYVTLVLWSRKN